MGKCKVRLFHSDDDQYQVGLILIPPAHPPVLYCFCTLLTPLFVTLAYVLGRGICFVFIFLFFYFLSFSFSSSFVYLIILFFHREARVLNAYV